MEHVGSMESQVIEFPFHCAINCIYVKCETGKARIISVFGMALHVLDDHQSLLDFNKLG